MTACMVCLCPTTDTSEYHVACLQALYGAKSVPSFRYDAGELYRVAAQMAGKMSISGIQEKVSLRLSADRSRLEVAATRGRYILKPEPARYSALPQNEHLSMRLATLVGIEIPPCGLLRLKDGTITYVIKRFDRTDRGEKWPVEDFCQLAEKPVRDKYNGSAELCVRLLRKYASEPAIEVGKFYRLLLFGWWISNGDMHLKNFSLLTEPDGLRRLSPVYDLVSTRLVIPNDITMALTLGGRNKRLLRKDWLAFGHYCGLPERLVNRMIADQVKILPRASEMIQISYLPDSMKQQFIDIISGNTAVLVESGAES